jgi:predicted metal-binding membrane protein
VGGLAASDETASQGATLTVGLGVRDALAAVRGRLGLVALLLAIAGLAWWWTARSMGGMDAGPGTDLGALGWFVGVWVVMMAAMMFPASAPTVALYARMTRRRGIDRPLMFAATYLIVWGTTGVAAYALWRLGRVTLASELSWSNAGRWLAAALLALAALYELTPLKNVCLQKCRSPLAFLLGAWREGRSGAVQMGARHALWCLGCCWALMVALFALGVMSLVWMVLVTALITLEKTLPWRRVALGSTTAILLALAILVAVAPADVPGLTIPGGMGHAMHGMS